MRKKILLAAFLLVTLISVLLLFEKQEPETANIPSKPVHYKERIGDLLYEIDMEQDVFDKDEPIPIKAKVTNLGDEPLVYYVGSSSCPLNISLKVVHSKKGSSLWNGIEACTADLVISTLEPSQSTEKEETFSGELYNGGRIKKAPSGTYNVEFSMVQPHEGDPVPGDIQPTEKFAGSSFTITLR